LNGKRGRGVSLNDGIDRRKKDGWEVDGMKESVAIAKDAAAKKESSPTRGDNSILSLRNEPERQLGSLRDVIGNIRRNGGTLLALQQTHGNQYVQRVVTGIQAKLKVGQPDDKYEQEADRVAEQVMGMPEPQVQRQVEEEEEEEILQTKPVGQGRAGGDVGAQPEVPPIVYEVLRSPGQPLNPATPILRESRFGHDFSRVRLGAQRNYGNPYVQRQINHVLRPMEAKGVEGQMEEIVASQTREIDISSIKSQLKTGTPLDQSTEKQMELSMGRDFDRVRIHTDPTADALCHQFQARAFTVGKDIAFAKGEYSPNAAEGRKLLTHELTHVIQQGEAPERVDKKSAQISSPLDPAEREAERVANELASREQWEVGYSEEVASTNLLPEQALQRFPRPLPSGAPIFEMVINADPIIRALCDMSRGHWLTDDINWVNHPVSDEIRRISGGNYFRGNNFYSSGWVDDEWPNWIDLGLWDVDVKVDLLLMVDNVRLVRRGGGTFTSRGATTERRTRTESTTVSGGAEASVGGHEGAPGGKVTGGVSRTTSSGRTLEVRGESGLSMTMPAVVSRADIIMRVSVHFNPTLESAWRRRRQLNVGHVIYGAPAAPTAPSR
jgi:hypothetical protein